MSIRTRIAMTMALASSMVMATSAAVLAKDTLRVTVAYYSAATEPYFKKCPSSGFLRQMGA